MKSRTGRRAAFSGSLPAAPIPTGIATASARMVETVTSARVSIAGSQSPRLQTSSRPSAVNTASPALCRVTNQTSMLARKTRTGAGTANRIS